MPSAELIKMVQDGLADHLAGRTDRAEQLYRRVLAIEPANADALHLLGVLLAQRGQYAEALGLLQQAATVMPGIAEFHRHVADVHAMLNQQANALAAYQRAAQLNPRDGNALYGAARAAAGLARDAEARTFLERFVQLDPNQAPAWADLGVILTRLGAIETAIQALERSLAIDGNSAHALTAYGDALRIAGHADQAYEPARRGAELQTSEAWPQIAYGNVLQVLARFDEAVAQYEKALALAPMHFDALNNLGLTRLKMGEPVAAMEVWDRAMQKYADNPNLRANRSLGMLTLGQLQQGFAEYESRFKSLAAKALPRHPAPRWQGEDLTGKTIVLKSEQGLGDTIQFARYIPMVAKRGARVIVACPAEIAELIQTIDGVAEVRAPGDAEPVFGYWSPMASLPHLFGTKLENIPAQAPYVLADAARIAAWRNQLGDDSRLKVGIVWAGSAMHQNDRARSCRLEEFLPLARIETVRLYSLQKGKPADALKSLPAGVEIVGLGEQLNSFSDTAALLEVLDLVISVDTSLVHLAGALARPVWTVISRGADWRWMMDREDTPWYLTMRLFRQLRMHDWAGVFARVEWELRELAK
jgi:tetratricopeptide (TPR) repeat protein